MLQWEVFFQDLMQLSQVMPDHLYNFCCQSFPKIPFGSVSDKAAVYHPEVKISPPNAAVVEPKASLVDPDCIADLVDGSSALFIPTEDVKVVLQQSQGGTQWLALTYDCVQILGPKSVASQATIGTCESGSRRAAEILIGPRRRSCNTERNSDRSVTASLADDPLYEVPEVQGM